MIHLLNLPDQISTLPIQPITTEPQTKNQRWFLKTLLKVELRFLKLETDLDWFLNIISPKPKLQLLILLLTTLLIWRLLTCRQFLHEQQQGPLLLMEDGNRLTQFRWSFLPLLFLSLSLSLSSEGLPGGTFGPKSSKNSFHSPKFLQLIVSSSFWSIIRVFIFVSFQELIGLLFFLYDILVSSLFLSVGVQTLVFWDCFEKYVKKNGGFKSRQRDFLPSWTFSF